MIFGIGTDIVEVERIRKLDSLEKFADKILSLNELEVFKSQIDEKQVFNNFGATGNTLWSGSLSHFNMKKIG